MRQIFDIGFGLAFVAATFLAFLLAMAGILAWGWPIWLNLLLFALGGFLVVIWIDVIRTTEP
jgi:hypothetical protein